MKSIPNMARALPQPTANGNRIRFTARAYDRLTLSIYSRLTGLLVAGGKRVLQLLEGDETAVRDTYLRIRRDPRHFACVLISEGRIPARQFDQWDMGLVRPGDAGDEQAALADIIAGIADRNLRAQFDGFLVVNGGQRSAA